MILFIQNLLHHISPVPEADLVGSSHLSGGSLAHSVEKLVKHINLLLTQRIFKGDTEVVELVRELSGVNIALSDIVHRINHLYSSFRFYCCKTNRPNITKFSLLRCCLRHAFEQLCH